MDFTKSDTERRGGLTVADLSLLEFGVEVGVLEKREEEGSKEER